MLSIEYLQKLNKSPELQAIEWYKCKEDPYYWLTNWARTVDNHWDGDEDICKPFPEKEYIRFITEKWLKHDVLIIPKTRQMMISWLIVALYLWYAQFHKGKFIVFQSKKEDDADYLVQRAKKIWDNEPNFMKQYYNNGKVEKLIANPQNKWNAVYCKLLFPSIDSSIVGVPQGWDIIRTYVISWMLSDESAFQPEMDDAYWALKPAISKWGKLTVVSTANAWTWFQDAVEDTLEMT